MIRIYFVSICIVIIAANFSPTWAYFYDSEESLFNMFMATLLDGEVEGEGFTGDICELGGEVTTDFSFKNSGAIPFTYNIHVPEISEDMQDFCNVISFTAFRNGDVHYIGLIESFSAEDLPLEVNGVDNWQFVATFADGVPDFAVDGKQCDFDTIFTATQLGFMGTQAFHDIETLSHSITGLAPTGNGGGDVTIIIENDATVINNVTTISNTGGNTTEGGDSDGGDGGDAETNTGNASATTTVTNVVNETNITVTTTCGECGSTIVTTCTSNCNSGGIKTRSSFINSILNDEDEGSAEEIEEVVEDATHETPDPEPETSNEDQ
ncbi:MAG: hypothetical protein COV34_00810 [Candidatus Zambryskibacteria bacterium CG10_big_fil_rev_8_21_14_0_10_42_12]|uniref:Uncharacterized protein n=1 Tax=Candidatus Zambryskibacteria bacterium CG10_big_fil_rev_8_21_14_0_10_42_12 TaxID=1975115 RepID=A0A2H0QWG7_9BACT|nr:MAG: hypothetical protein COV34_00810 [Candidatus Zambryskibacteria bacterium CG10_big_fil_rev_8_21_14_0_10_42_12]